MAIFDLTAEQQVLCLAARTQLAAAEEQQLLELLRGPLDWERLWAQGHLHEILPLLTTTLRRLQSRAPSIPEAWMARAQRRLYATLMRNNALADEMTQLIGSLRDAGVEGLPIKGIVLAETLYGSLALRPAADIDVLVHPRDLTAARTALAARGYTQSAEPSFTDLEHPFHDPPYFLESRTGQICLELHWGLWSERFFHLGADALWERAVAVRIHNTPMRILSPEDTLLHLAIHRSRSPLRLRLVCDFAELLRRHGATLDWDAVLSRAGAAGARTAMFYSLALAQDLLGAPLPAGILPQLGVGRLKQRLLDHTCGAAALFRPAPDGDLAQQPHLTLRVLEQDGFGHIARTLGFSLMRTTRKHVFNMRRRVGI